MTDQIIRGIKHLFMMIIGSLLIFKAIEISAQNSLNSNEKSIMVLGGLVGAVLFVTGCSLNTKK